MMILFRCGKLDPSLSVCASRKSVMHSHENPKIVNGKELKIRQKQAGKNPSAQPNSKSIEPHKENVRILFL